ncbi:MAG: Crp/Fnr family transcriptional regulator [Actinobacteria bacterium]|nr:Crp/Fnr family transcriptional regulator [Actinomycetota bacterium]
MANSGRIKHFRKGTYLFHQDDDAVEVFFLIEGSVELSSLSQSGQRQWLTTIHEPQFLGELAILGEMPTTASGVAIEETTVWCVAGKAFLDFLAGHPAAGRELMRALARQVQAHGSLVDDLLFLDLKGRVAKRLVGLVSPSLDMPAENGAVVPLVTHADLASLAGGSRENVSRILSDFQRRRLLKRVGRRYVLTDIAALLKIAGM